MAKDKEIKSPDTAGLENKLKASVSRRSFFKKAVIGGVAVAATAALAKKAADHLIPEGNHQQAYLNDVLPGDKILSSWEYVVMERKEKEALIRSFVENYKKNA